MAPGVRSQRHGSAFDGRWRATGVGGAITVTVSGDHVWRNGASMGDFRRVSQAKCVLVSPTEDVSGFLSEDGQTITWADGDSWECISPLGEVERSADGDRSPGDDAADKLEADAPLPSGLPALPHELAGALLARDGAQLSEAAEAAGHAVTVAEVDATELWRAMKWKPEWDGAPPRTPLLVAAIMLGWPEGVVICVRCGADVNEAYSGPLPVTGGGSVCVEEASILEVALSAHGAAQALTCHAILSGRVKSRTFNAVKRSAKARARMEDTTAAIFDQWVGPFFESARRKR
eukprot:NODE_12401_length_1227_cov_3.632727.p1 GENE.NODE_12401_length_1227_cov_3.632727~~NODE_12401_length_1227_cov_3.632727.p1  ORF type:complete len:290 (+),score=90.25 NODE_12401_length_1227_cov_3.632727:51-920(+)